MNHLLRLIFILILLAQASVIVTAQTNVTQNLPSVALCEVLAHPQSYRDKQIQVRVIYRVGFEWQEIYSLRCPDASTWLEFSDGFEEASSRKALKQMNSGNHFSITVGVVLEGRLTGSGGGFGHMNGYENRFTADRVRSAKRLDTRGCHPRALTAEDRKRIEKYESSAGAQ